MSNILFLDIETTGLDETKGKVLEVSAIVVNDTLEELSTFSEVVGLMCTVDSLNMTQYVRDMHTSSGLLEATDNSPLFHLKDLEDLLCNWLELHYRDRVILAGNSIHFDRKWIKLHMPRFEKYLHYRMIDVSSMYEAFSTFKGIHLPKKTPAHRGLSDCRDSIALLKQLLEYVKN